MALRGNLKDFSLPDVFQLVTLSRKTGILRIRRSDGAEGGVWFRDGDVFFAQSNWHREPLGERLVSAAKITPSALSRALDVQKTEGTGGRRLGQILVDEGYITDKVLEAFVQEQIQDTIFDLFRWDEGDFDFEPLEGAPEEDIGLSVSIENIVMEGSRRLEEWNRIKKKIPSMEIVFKMATAPGEGTFEISLKPVEWNLLLLVDGTRSVSQLAGDTRRTDFEVARVLYGLFSAGLLEVASDEEVEKLRGERERLEARAEELRAKAAAAAPKKRKAQPAPVAEAPAEQPLPAAPQAESGREVPAFLAQQPSADASPEDMAVFEQMMGAVLQVPVEGTAGQTEAPVEPEPAQEPPVELAPAPESPVEPDLTVETAPEPGPAPPVAPEFAPERAAAEAEPPAEPEQGDETVAEATADAGFDLEPMPGTFGEDLLAPLDDEPTVGIPIEVEPPGAPEEVPLSASDFFTVGEEEQVPEDEGPVAVVEEPAEEPGIEEPAEEPQVAEPMSIAMVEPPVEAVPEPPAQAEVESVEVESVEVEIPEPLAEPEPVESPAELDVAEVADTLEAEALEVEVVEMAAEPAASEPEGAEADGELTIAEIEAAARALEQGRPLEGVDIQIVPAPLEDEEPAASWITDESADDLSDLLSALREEAEESPEAEADSGPGLVETVSLAPEPESEEEAPTTGVISTDAFLSDFDGMSESSFSGGLGDELTALTGGGRTRPNVVSTTPLAAEHTALRRDDMVDKDLVMKVIEGIKNL